jgi:flavin-binding protein dodecin
MEEPDCYYSRFTEQEVNTKLDRANDMWQTVDVGEVVDVEMLVYDSTVGYAGRLDMLTKIQQKVTLVDLKTGNYYAKYPLQIAAYARASPLPVYQALIVRLDLNLDRNPESEVDMIWYDRAQLDEYEAKFVVKAKKYHEDQQVYIDMMA